MREERWVTGVILSGKRGGASCRPCNEWGRADSIADEFADYLRADTDNWADVAKGTGVQSE